MLPVSITLLLEYIWTFTKYATHLRIPIFSTVLSDAPNPRVNCASEEILTVVGVVAIVVGLLWSWVAPE